VKHQGASVRQSLAFPGLNLQEQAENTPYQQVIQQTRQASDSTPCSSEVLALALLAAKHPPGNL
jgi:hypothetical protein